MIDTDVLLGCPFCGGRPRIIFYGNNAGDFSGGRFVSCMECGAASIVFWGDEHADRVIAEKWNRREPLPQPPREDEAGEGQP